MKEAKHRKILYNLIFGLKDNKIVVTTNIAIGAKSRRWEPETRGELRRQGKEKDDQGQRPATPEKSILDHYHTTQ